VSQGFQGPGKVAGTLEALGGVDLQRCGLQVWPTE